MIKNSISLVFAFLLAVSAIAQKSINLHSGWQFSQAGKNQWKPAQVPGTVHTDLMANKLIDDPFYRDNEARLQWIDKVDWEYKTTFTAPVDILSAEKQFLIFEGLDTYTEIYLNNQLLGKTDNMFIEHKFDVFGKLLNTENTLRIVFKSPIVIGLAKHAANGYTIPVSSNDQAKHGQVEGEKQVSVFTRKAGYHFGWDWGPRLVTSGIWRPVRLEAYGSLKIIEAQIEQKNIATNTAELRARTQILSDGLPNSFADVFVDGQLSTSQPLPEMTGLLPINIDFVINNRQLWWPIEMGDQKLYNIEIRVRNKNAYIDTLKTRIGLRTIELVTNPDTAGNQFYFRVNGLPMFAKGANYIPNDNFLPRVTDSVYRHVIGSAKALHMNMLRVWGGGIYENKLFYDLCDEAGILVWQDFMFACAMFPADTAFINNVRREAIYNVKRLHNHPSVALWCGNNEILTAWQNWGWKKKFEKDEPLAVKMNERSYNLIFNQLLPDVVKTYSPNKPYWESSPQSFTSVSTSGQLTSGDVHYWDVWWKRKPFSEYKTNIGRFMSEYGFQSFPELKTIEKFALPADYQIESTVMKAHQRSEIGNSAIADYMARHYMVPKNFKQFIYVGHLLQALGIKSAIEGHRLAAPRNMGSLFWQINDCWPVASWSSMDYYGRWKAQMFMTERAYKPTVAIINKANDGGVNVFVQSTLTGTQKNMLNIKLISFEGKIISDETQEVVNNGLTPVLAKAFKPNQLPAADMQNRVVLVTTLTDKNNTILHRNEYYFVEPKDLKLPTKLPKVKIGESNGKPTITLTANSLTKDVFIVAGEGQFSDNYFDLLPNESRTLNYSGAVADLKNLKIYILPLAK